MQTEFSMSAFLTHDIKKFGTLEIECSIPQHHTELWYWLLSPRAAAYEDSAHTASVQRTENSGQYDRQQKEIKAENNCPFFSSHEK